VKPTLSQTLSLIFQRACDKFKISSAKYTLCDARGKELDLSLSYRLSGVAPGAKLEIRRRTGAAAKSSQGSVLVALQLPEGGRVQASLPLSTRLWDVLLHFEQESDNRLNLTKRVAPAKTSEGGDYLQPVITYLRREVGTIAELYKTTLLGLGLDGNGLLRLAFRPSGKRLESVQDELEAVQASEQKYMEELEKAEEEKTKRKHKEQERVRSLMTVLADPTDPAKETVSLPPERLDSAQETNYEEKEMEETTTPKKAKVSLNELESEEEEKLQKQKVDQLVAKKEKQMEQSFLEMEQAGLEQTRIEGMRAIMQTRFDAAKADAATTGSDNQKAVVRDDPMQVVKNPNPNSSFEVPERELRVRPPSDKPFNPKDFEVPESFYELTQEDYKMAMDSIKANKARLEEESLMKTKEMREKERLQRIPKYRKTLIKVRFPNRVELQATFHPLEKAEAVYKVVKESLAHPDRPFYLFTTPPKQRLDRTKSLLSLVMVPAAIVYFSWEDKSAGGLDYLSEDLMVGIEPTEFPRSQPTSTGNITLETLGRVLGLSSSSTSRDGSSSQPAASRPPEPRDRASRTQGSKVVPKWFKTGKKW